MVALMVSIAVNAAPSSLWLVGNPAGGNWGTGTKTHSFTPKGNGVFVYETAIDGSNTNQWFRFHDGTNIYGPNENGAELKMGENLPVKSYGEAGTDNAFKITTNITKITVVFDDTKNTIKIYGGDATTEPVNPSDDTKYAIKGTIFGDSDWTNYALEEEATGVWSITRKIVAGDFGLKSYTGDISSQKDWIAANSATTIKEGSTDAYVAIGGSNNIHNELVGNYKITYDINAGKVTFEKQVNPNEKEYTVYFYDTNGWTPYVWIWKKGTTDAANNYTGGVWGSSPAMTKTDLKYKVGDQIKDVYSYTFYTDDEGDKEIIIKNNAGDPTDGGTTGDQAFFNKAIYTNSGLIAKDGEFEFYVEPTVDPYDVTFYYINKGYANGWECPEAHVFAGEESQDVPGVKTNDRYKDPQDGNIYDVIKYVFTANKEISKYQLCFKVGTSYSGSNFALKKGALYCTGAIANENPTWYIAGEDTSSKTIYFNMGADYMLDKDKKWVVDGKKIAPYAIFQNKAGEWSMKKQMEKVDGEDCMFKVTFDASMYKSVKFSNDKSGAALLEYPIDSEAALTHNKELAGEGWYTYIYVADGDFVESTKTYRYWATQSWLPFDEYIALRDGVRTQYCVTDDATNWHKDAYTVPMNEEEGVCMFESSRIGKGKKFKLSYIAPFDTKQVKKGENGNDANIQRWWATFNLGIVGPAVSESEATEDGTNKYVDYSLRTPRPYNHYCKYDWRVWYTEELPEGTTVYVVIDPNHKTTTLITFNPQPTLDGVTVNNIKARELTEEENASITNVGQNIQGFDVHGEARIRRVNNLLTTATIHPSAMPEEFYNMYQVKYTIYMNDVPMETYLRQDLIDNGKYNAEVGTYSLELKSLAPGEKDKVTFDATYTMKKDGNLTDLKFGSKKQSVEVGTKTDYPEFNKIEVLESYATPAYEDKDRGEMVWDAIVKVSFEMSQATTVAAEGENVNEFVYYPEVDVTTAEGNKGYIADSGNRFYSKFHQDQNKYNWTTKGGDKYVPHTKYTEGAYDHATHNWSIKSRDAGVFHIYLPGVGRTTGDFKNPGQLQEFNFDIELTAAYPFIVDKRVDVFREKAHNAPKRAADNSGDKDIVFVREVYNPGTQTVTNVNIGTSGINDVDIDAIEGEGELYNLQGVRVYGEPTPGIYLRRQGNQVVKVAIR